MPSKIQSVVVPCPAKINLSLAILGPRADGFHALESVVAQSEFGDELTLGWAAGADPASDTFTVEGACIPESENSVKRAIDLFREEAGFREGAYQVHLRKRIPLGSGLGGGSSDAVATLKALQLLHGDSAPQADWIGLAQRLGSDCPLFMREAAVLMRGRGERVTPLPESLGNRLRGLPVVLFKPGFSISTVEAYRRLARLRWYSAQESAQRLLTQWRASGARVPADHNDFERLVGEWLPSLAIVLTRLRERHGLDARMSGSGSACFAFSEDLRSATSRIREEAERAWGPSFWVRQTCLK